MLMLIALNFSTLQYTILISIHLMLMLIPVAGLSFETNTYFNTSHVNVNLTKTFKKQLTGRNFNTSHVNVNPNPVVTTVADNCKFQYISC